MFGKLFGQRPKASFALAIDAREEALAFQVADPKSGVVGGWLDVAAYDLPPEHHAGRLVLDQWLAEGRGEIVGDEFVVEANSLYLADDADLRALPLPPPAPYIVGLRANGRLDQPDFTIDWSFRDVANRPMAGVRRIACFLDDGAERAFLSAAEYDLLRALEAFKARGRAERTAEAQLLAFTKIKTLAEVAGASMDAYLERETAIAPAAVSIDLVRHGADDLEVLPVVRGIAPTALGQALDESVHVPAILTVPGQDGVRQRVVLNPDVQEALAQVKGVRRLRGKDRTTFLARPQEFLDANIINLEDFGERVRGIGAHQIRYYPLIRSSDRKWIPDAIGLTLAPEDPEAEPLELTFDTLADFEPLERACAEARARGEAAFNWQGHSLPIDGDTSTTIGQVHEALKLRDDILAEQGPSEVEDDQVPHPPIPDDDGRNVLLIHANEEAADYAEELPSGAAAKTVTLPQALKPGVTLLPHQVEGLAFLQHVYAGRGRGVLLGDDMGLGKTLQVLAFLAWAHEQSATPRPILVVAPVALLENWRDEYRKFLEPLWGEPLELHGERMRLFRVGQAGGREYHGAPKRLLDVTALAGHPFVLTTYEAVRDYQFSLASIDWGVVVADEAQKIKTPGALMTNAIKALKADFRVVATGTPVENSLVDLWCLVDFTQPGLLGALKAFRAEFDQPKDREAEGGEATAGALRERIDPVFLRRLKMDIMKDLPSRTEHEVPIAMSPSQAEQYLRISEGFRQGNKGAGAILGVLQKLRDVSCHPALAADDEPRVDASRLEAESPKLAWVLRKLEEIRGRNEKCILFTENRRLQRILAHLVHQRFGFVPAIVNGEIPGASSSGRSRKSIIDDFQQGPGFGVIVLSPVAVGFGLTITAANHVIHVTRLWNPAKEDQATDRTHRIGQTKAVEIYYPLAVDPAARFDSFDKILAGLLSRKRELARNVLFPTRGLDLGLDEFAKVADWD